MDVSVIREKFVRFFVEKGHTHVPSSSLIPSGDPTLLFTNSGMMQFKDVFLGAAGRDYATAVTVQRCLRAGGKHNDLENVGFTTRHHTFFEMLGNFSFGEYFKEKAIPYAWEFLTSPDWLGIPRQHLWITVFGGGKVYGADSPHIPADDEARTLWMETLMNAGFSRADAAARIIDIPTTDNFWMMGNTGPCGPCSEIFYDKDANATRFRGEEEEFADICVEIWNLVFMQYNRTDEGELPTLPAPCIDTGMGLERISAVLQEVDSNYKTDLFCDLIAAINDITDCKGAVATASHNVISDHIRASAMLIADGVFPSNEGRGYVLRRIIRRALRHLQKIKASDEPRFHLLVAPLVQLMGDSYPVLCKHQDIITDSLRREEELFTSGLKNGMRLLEEAMRARGKKESKTPLAGEVVFRLYDTFGFPPDMTATIAKEEYGIGINEAEFEACMEAQRQRSRQAMKFKINEKTLAYDGADTEFVGYTAHTAEANIAALYCDEQAVESVTADEKNDEAIKVLVVLNRTPFYAESGGQIGDIGSITTHSGAVIEIIDTQKIRPTVWGHLGVLRSGSVQRNDAVFCEIDRMHRAQVTRAHSAAHLLHAALHEVLGKHATQRGSRVGNDNIRFDFAHHQAVSPAELKDIEAIINHHVICNHASNTEEMPFDDAIARGAMALFGEKYGARVRLVTIGEPFSVELCGGTHVDSSGDIGLFQFTAESAIAVGVRRVEAVCAYPAFELVRQQREQIATLAATLKTPANRIEEKINHLQDSIKRAEKQIAQLQAAQMGDIITELARAAEDINGIRVLIQHLPDSDGKHLREIVIQLSSQLKPAAILLASENNGVAVFSAASSAPQQVKANEWLRAAAALCDAKGGGKDHLAQAGGGDPTKIAEALAHAKAALQK